MTSQGTRQESQEESADRTRDHEPPQASAPAAEPPEPIDPGQDRRLRRARFLAELAEARELRRRVAPRRTRAAEIHEKLLRTFRY